MTERTLITFLLDRTGSMNSCKDATIEAFNGYIEALKTGGEAAAIEFTFLQFDSVSLDKICVSEDIHLVKPLTAETYQPRASTPLVDAAFKTIKAVDFALTKRDDHPKIVICIQTDGEENASTEHTMSELNALIKEKSALNWQFNFMGAGIDAYAQSRQMGIPMASSLSYRKDDRAATLAAFYSSAQRARSFVSGASKNTAFSSEDRKAAGDIHASKHVDPASPAIPAPDASSTTPKPKAKAIVDDIVL
jgi:hypothetical protein